MAKAFAGLARVHILVIEDDDDIRQGIADLLTLHGAVVSQASSGEEGLRRFDDARPDLVLSDLWMARGDGLELIRAIRGYPPEQGGLTPAIALSAGGDEKTAMMAGYHALMAKPFDFAKLLELVEDFARSDGAERLIAPFTVRKTRPGHVLVELHSDLRGPDMRNLMSTLFHFLDDGPVDVFVDLRRLDSFAPSVGSVGERALWSRRKLIRSVHTLGGSLLARLVSAAACNILGIAYHEEADASRMS